MAFNIDYCTFEFLSVAKDLYDYGLLDKVLESYGSLEICDDCYSLAWDGIASAFTNFRSYFREETGVETLVFFDPVITEFYRLCALYEERRGIRKDRDLFRDEMEKEVYQCFCLSSYDFDVLLFDGSRKGGARLVILSGEEFYGHTELPGALAEARNTFKNHCERLKKALAPEISQADAPENTQKEAA